MTRGIEIDTDTLSFENIKEVCLSGEGHYLGSDKTLKVMESEYIYPEFGDRTSPTVWEDAGKPMMLEHAIAQRDKILSNYFPKHISDEIDAEIRSKFPIHLSAKNSGR